MVDMVRAERLRRITAAEDRAREIRNSIGASGLPYVSADTVQELADVLAQALQAIREGL
jgi:hypothetical protein